VDTWSEDGTAVVGVVKVEMDVSEDVKEAPCPIVVEPALSPVIESVRSCVRRRSERAVRKRSMLLPGELDEDFVATA